MNTRDLSPLASLLVSTIPHEVTSAYRAGVIGRTMFERAVRAAAFGLIITQDEEIDLRKYVNKIELAVQEVELSLR